MIYRAEVWIEGQLVECLYSAPSVEEAWKFAVRNFYPADSTKQMRVSRVRIG